MTYLAWAAFYEGNADRSYYDVLIPRLLEDIIMKHGHRQVIVPEMPAVPLGRNGRSIQEVATEICANRDSFYLVFIHADTGGRALEDQIGTRSAAYCEAAATLCAWPVERCLIIAPRHETEAWMLADPQAIMSAFGYHGSARDLDLPANAREAENLNDPKAILESIYGHIRGRRSGNNLYQSLPNIARSQSIDLLRASRSFQKFEVKLRAALVGLGCLPQ